MLKDNNTGDSLKPKISVVLTSYNHKDYLSQSLEAIINQTFKNYEFIIWDDNSTDGSQAVLKAFKEKHPEIKLYLNDTNSGRYTISTNNGASKAKGDYIIFEQCDDFADPTQLETLFNHAKEHPDAGMVFSASRMVDETGTVMGSDYNVRSNDFRKFCKQDVIIPRDKLESFLLESCVLPNLSAVLIRRDVYEEMNGLDEQYYVIADWDFYLKVSKKYDAFYVRNELNNFRQHGTTIRSSVKMETQIKELLQMFGNHFGGVNLSDKIQKKAYITVSNVWWSFMKNNPKVWYSSFFKVLKMTSQFSKRLPMFFLWQLFLHPFRSVSFRLSHIR